MLNVGKLNEGVVLDHIPAGKAMDIYKALNLGDLDCSVAILMNVPSSKMGKKDIIKIDKLIHLDFTALGYVDPGITVNTINNGNVSKKRAELPRELRNVLKCRNPRCITSTEQELDHVFKLTDRENKIYRCIYCETKANN